MSDRLDSITSDAARPVSRRTVVRGAAWSVPVVMVAAAAPALAASCVAADITLSFIGPACHQNNGNSIQRWSASFTLDNASSSTGTVRMTSVTVNTGEAVIHTTGTITIAGGGSALTAFFFDGLLSAGTTRTFTVTLLVDEATCPTTHTETLTVTYAHC